MKEGPIHVNINIFHFFRTVSDSSISWHVRFGSEVQNSNFSNDLHNASHFHIILPLEVPFQYGFPVFSKPNGYLGQLILYQLSWLLTKQKMYIEGAIVKSCSCGWIEFHPMTIVLFCAISLLLSLPLSLSRQISQGDRIRQFYDSSVKFYRSQGSD